MNAKMTQEEKWQLTQDRLAESSGLAIVIADADSPELAKSNNNSICEVLYNSKEFAPECAKFCGKAFDWATEAGKTVEYKCYANLNCLAVPVQSETKSLVAIVGRTFLKAEDYRAATARAISGDWQKFPPTEFFENVLLSSSIRTLETAAKQIENLSPKEKDALLKNVSGEITTAEKLEAAADSQTNEIAALVEEFQDTAAQQQQQPAAAAIVSEKLALRNSEEAKKISEWRSLLGSLLDLNYSKACETILQFVSKRYQVSSLGWLEEGRANQLEMIIASENLKEQSLELPIISSDDKRLHDAVKTESSLELPLLNTRRKEGDENNANAAQTIQLFPITVGGKIRSALIVGSEIAGENKKRQISRFCRTIAPQLEILRLREELNKRGWLDRAVQRFSETIKDIDTADFWTNAAQISAELMRAERSSLLIFDEKSNLLLAKAAIGAHADEIEKEKENLGEKIARKVLQTGKPLMVQDIRDTEFPAAPRRFGYKSNSFISYPITIGQRKIGVLNITDRAAAPAGESFDVFDLEILNAIMPQLAISIDRALLKHKAGEFEQLSVTDALTGLLNRLYLEARLPEEIKRSNRAGSPMSFMAIDVDNFKSYNDNFGHPEGDKALKIVAHCLKETLRGADVAVRHGGEEFSILLPQTTSDEAAVIGERVREKVASTEFPNRQVTISIGVASCPNNTVCSAEEIIKWADDALYEAKRRGRNNVQIYENLKDDFRID